MFSEMGFQSIYEGLVVRSVYDICVDIEITESYIIFLR
jgi:hypothetical protein